MILKAYCQEGGLLSVTLPRGEYRCQGELCAVMEYQEERIIEAGAVLERLHHDKFITAWVNTETGEQINPAEYERRKQALETEETRDEENKEWRTIHARHAFELFRATWNAIYETHVLVEPVELEVYGEESLNHPFVVALRKVGWDLDNTLYEYRVEAHILAAVRECLDAADIPYERGKECFEFFKFGKKSSFLTIEIPELKPLERCEFRRGTQAAMIAEYDRVDALVKRAIRGYVNRNRPLRVVTIGVVKKGLLNIKDRLCSVRPVRASYGVYIDLRDDLAKLLALVNDEAVEEEVGES